MTIGHYTPNEALAVLRGHLDVIRSGLETGLGADPQWAKNQCELIAIALRLTAPENLRREPPPEPSPS